MKITRLVDIDVRVGEGRGIRMQEEVEFDISGEEAFYAICPSDGTEVIDAQLKSVLNRFARFIRAVPEETIQALSPEACRTIAGFLEGSAKRFAEKPAAEHVQGFRSTILDLPFEADLAVPVGELRVHPETVMALQARAKRILLQMGEYRAGNPI